MSDEVKCIPADTQMYADRRVTFENFFTLCDCYRETLRLGRNAAANDMTVLLVGPTGTGKNFLGQAIHNGSRRHGKPWVEVNLAAIPEGQVEGELFGYRKGAFTSSDRSHSGAFLRANEGTLFLNEVHALDRPKQMKLLSVLEHLEVPLLGERPVRVDLRILLATSLPLAEIQRPDGPMLPELFHRIARLVIPVPTLRERGKDILFYFGFFLRKAAEQTRKKAPALTAAARALVPAQPWPGNLRDLKNTACRIVVNGTRDVCDAEDVLRAILIAPGAPQEVLRIHHGPAGIDRRLLIDTLIATKGNKRRTARLLGISKTTLYTWLDKHCIADNEKIWREGIPIDFLRHDDPPPCDPVDPSEETRVLSAE